ncbi:MAG: hypothetical protein GY926_10850 [bacterium]|nr:hypothetical protein [bacterium]
MTSLIGPPVPSMEDVSGAVRASLFKGREVRGVVTDHVVAAAGPLVSLVSAWFWVLAVETPSAPTVGIGAFGSLAFLSVIFRQVFDARTAAALREEQKEANSAQATATDAWEQIATAQRERANLAEARVLEYREDLRALRQQLREGDSNG